MCCVFDSGTRVEHCPSPTVMMGVDISSDDDNNIQCLTRTPMHRTPDRSLQLHKNTGTDISIICV